MMRELFRKKSIAAIAGLLLSIGLLSGCGSQGAQGGSQSAAQAKDDNYVVRLAESSDLCSAPQQIALEKGFFEKEGLKVEMVKVGKDTNNFEAISAGQIDASNSLVASIIQPVINGADIKITTGLHTGCLQILVKPGSGIKSPADLKGKKIGVTSVAGSPATFTKRYLGDNGVNVSPQNSEVEFAAYSSSDLPIVLNNGSVDAIALGDPATEILKKEYGFVTLASSATTEPFNKEYCCVAYVSSALAEKHPQAALKFTRALQEASAWIAEHPDETAKIQKDKKYVDGDLATNLIALKSYNFIPSVSGGENAFIQVGKDLQKLGIIDQSIDLQKLQGNAFLHLDGIDPKYQ